MRIFKKMLSMVLIVCLVVSMSATAFAADTSSNNSNFKQMTKQEYLKIKAKSEGISLSEANQELDKIMEKDIEKYGVNNDDVYHTDSFEQTDTEPGSGGVTYLYGVVYFVDRHLTKLKVRSEVPVMIASHHYGRTFSDVNTSAASVYALNDGVWDFEGTATAYKVSAQKVKITYSGIIDIEAGIAVNLGIPIGKLDLGGSISMTKHSRTHASGANNEILSSSN